MNFHLKRRKRKSRKGEIVCSCLAYRFPHRLTSGRCSGLWFVEEFFEGNAWGSCRSCRYLCLDNGLDCEVVLGLEPAHECPEFSEYLDRNEVPVPSVLGRKSWG